MAVALHGNLRDFGISEVFQLIGQQRKTGILRVEGDDAPIFLAFEEGRVVGGGPGSGVANRDPLGPQLVRSGYLTKEQLKDIQVESRRTARPLSALLLAVGLVDATAVTEVRNLLMKETVFDLMRRGRGDFEFIAEPVFHNTRPEDQLGAEQILMDGLRMLDEWQTFESFVPDEAAVFRRVSDPSSIRSVSRQEEDSRLAKLDRVLQLVDGRLSVRRIIDLSRMGSFEATRALAELRQASAIELIHSPKGTPGARRTGRASRVRLLPLLRVAVATTIPFVTLALLGAAVLDRSEAGGGLVGTKIPARSIEHFGARYESDLVRRALEVYFFEQGHYPDRLEELSQRTVSLTPERLGEYYYVVGDEGIVLLAPAD